MTRCGGDVIDDEVFRRVALVCSAYPFKVGVAGIVQHPLISHCVEYEHGEFVLITTENFRERLLRRLDILKRSEDVGEMLFIHINKPHRVSILDFIGGLLSDEEFGKLLREAWTDVEWPGQHGINNLIRMFDRAKPHLMTEKERAAFDALPDTLTVYRGLQGRKASVRGLSWTLDLETARWFAQRWEGNRPVYRATIAKRHCFMFTDKRREQEIVLNPRYLKGVVVEPPAPVKEQVNI